MEKSSCDDDDLKDLISFVEEKDFSNHEHLLFDESEELRQNYELEEEPKAEISIKIESSEDCTSVDFDTIECAAKNEIKEECEGNDLDSGKRLDNGENLGQITTSDKRTNLDKGMALDNDITPEHNITLEEGMLLNNEKTKDKVLSSDKDMSLDPEMNSDKGITLDITKHLDKGRTMRSEITLYPGTTLDKRTTPDTAITLAKTVTLENKKSFNREIVLVQDMNKQQLQEPCKNLDKIRTLDDELTTHNGITLEEGDCDLEDGVEITLENDEHVLQELVLPLVGPDITREPLNSKKGNNKRKNTQEKKKDVESNISGKKLKRGITENRNNVENLPGTKNIKKPSRLCIFCNEYRTKLSTHLENFHKNEPRVSEILNLPRNLRLGEFRKIRREGIYRENMKRLANNLETKSDRGLIAAPVLCPICKSFFSKNYLRRHKQICIREVRKKKPVLEYSFSSMIDHKFDKEIRKHFKNDAFGKLCLDDVYLMEIGRCLWYMKLRNGNKGEELRNLVIDDISQIVLIYQEGLAMQDTFGALSNEQIDIRDIFKNENIKFVSQAIDNLSLDNDGNVKPGFKENAKKLILRICRALMIIYLHNDEDEKEREVNNYMSLFKLPGDIILTETYVSIKKESRKAMVLPSVETLKEDVHILRKYILSEIERLSSKFLFDLKSFVLIRDLIISRLVLFNGRKNLDPSGLEIQDWEEAKFGTWLKPEKVKLLDPINIQIIDHVKLVYKTEAEDDHEEPILFPKDVFAGLTFLCSPLVREKLKVPEENKYIFAASNGSMNHVLGNHCLERICKLVDLKHTELVAGVQIRHIISEYFVMMDLDPKARKFVEKSMGNTSTFEDIIYPPSLKEGKTSSGSKKINENEISSTSDEPSNLNSREESENLESEETLQAESFPQNENTGMKRKREKDPESDEFFITIQRKRQVSHCWKESETNLVLKYFKDYLLGRAEKKLPGRKDILEFLKEHPTFSKPWKVIHTKVMNEKRVRFSEPPSKTKKTQENLTSDSE